MSQGHQHGPDGQVIEQRKPPETLEEWREWAGVLEAQLDEMQEIHAVTQEKLSNLDQDQTVRIAGVRKRDKHIARLTGMIDQISAENRVLRKRLELGETEPIEVDDVEDADVLGNAQLADAPPDAPEQPAAPGQPVEEQPVTEEPAPDVAPDPDPASDA